MFVFPKEKVSMVVQVQWEVRDDMLHFHCFKMSGNPIDTYIFYMNEPVYVKNLLEKLRETLGDDLSPAHQIMLAGQDLEPLSKHVAVWSPKVKNVKPAQSKDHEEDSWASLQFDEQNEASALIGMGSFGRPESPVFDTYLLM